MTTKRKPTFKQLFTAWKKHKKKESEVWNEKYAIEKMAKQMEEGTELINDGESIYRVTVTQGWNATYKIERIAKAEELNNIK